MIGKEFIHKKTKQIIRVEHTPVNKVRGTRIICFVEKDTSELLWMREPMFEQFYTPVE